MPLSFYSESRKGDIMSRMTGDVAEVEWSIMSSLEMLFREPIAIILSITTLFFIDWQLTLFALALLPVGGLVIGFVGA